MIVPSAHNILWLVLCAQAAPTSRLHHGHGHYHGRHVAVHSAKHGNAHHHTQAAVMNDLKIGDRVAFRFDRV